MTKVAIYIDDIGGVGVLMTPTGTSSTDEVIEIASRDLPLGVAFKVVSTDDDMFQLEQADWTVSESDLNDGFGAREE